MIIYGLVAIIALQAILHYYERKDLYNRLMCKNITEYKNIDTPEKKIFSAHERVLKEWRGEKQ